MATTSESRTTSRSLPQPSDLLLVQRGGTPFRATAEEVKAFMLSPATAAAIGAIKPGTNLSVDADGTLHAAISGALTYRGAIDPTTTEAPAEAAVGDVYLSLPAAGSGASEGVGKERPERSAVTGAGGSPGQGPEVCASSKQQPQGECGSDGGRPPNPDQRDIGGLPLLAAGDPSGQWVPGCQLLGPAAVVCGSVGDPLPCD